jgi:hypothetical protein
MARPTERRRGIRLGGVAAALAIAGPLALSGIATAGPDQLKGGSVAIQLKNARGLKLTPKSLNLPITTGSVDPISGAGTVQVSGGFRAKRGKAKAKVTITALTLAPDGGQGSVSAKVGKKKVALFGTLTGGTVARNGWGATISNIRATIAGKGAQALNKAFSPRKSGSAKKSAAGGVKAGQPLGTVVSVTTDPLSVEVVPNSGTLTLQTNLGGAFASKLPQHCISPLTGVTPIQPATQSLADFSFPVSGGSAAPDFTAGELLTAGGQTLTKGSGPPLACTSASPPVGTKLVSTEPGVNFAENTLQSTATLPDGLSFRASLATIDFSTGTRSVDPGTKQLTVSGATVSLSYPAALTLNTLFPNVGSPSNDFAGGDEIGTIDLTAKLR